jgi:hypothetical protein
MTNKVKSWISKRAKRLCCIFLSRTETSPSSGRLGSIRTVGIGGPLLGVLLCGSAACAQETGSATLSGTGVSLQTQVATVNILNTAAPATVPIVSGSTVVASDSTTALMNATTSEMARRAAQREALIKKLRSEIASARTDSDKQAAVEAVRKEAANLHLKWKNTQESLAPKQ